MASIPAAGLTNLHDPPNPDVDIIFIHGFNGHPCKTWFTTHSTPPLSARLTPRASPSNPLLWPRDLLPLSIPSARIFTYGYDDTRVRLAWGEKGKKGVLGGAGTKESTLRVVARGLREELGKVRRGERERERPVVFVVHSFGGLVVKEGGNDPGEVLDATIGIVFFGTPHGGADPGRAPHRLARRVGRKVGIEYNEEVVEFMKPGATGLKELGESFLPLVEGRGWEIHSFQEGEGLWWLFGEKVVDDLASRLGVQGETTDQIPRNHKEMCRFGSLHDVEYQKAVAAIEHMTTGVSEQLASRRRWIVDRARNLGEVQVAVLLLSMLQEKGPLRTLSRSWDVPVYLLSALYILFAAAWVAAILDVVPIRVKRGKRGWTDLIIDVWVVVYLGILSGVGSVVMYYIATQLQPQKVAPTGWPMRNHTRTESEVWWGGLVAVMRLGKSGASKTLKGMMEA